MAFSMSRARGKRLPEKERVRVCFEMDFALWNEFKGETVYRDTSIKEVLTKAAKDWMGEK